MKVYMILQFIEDNPPHSVWFSAYRTREAAEDAIAEYLAEARNEDVMDIDIDPDEFEIHELDLED